MVKKGEIISLRISDYAFEGKGIAKLISEDGSEKKFVIFVNGAYPGDEVKAVITKKKKSYAEAKVTELLTKSENRTEARCNHFPVCGGCKQQDLVYEKQLYYKQQQVMEVFEKIGGFKEINIQPIIPSNRQFYYRNKLEYSFARKRWLTENEIKNSNEIFDKDFALGFHVPRIFDKVLNISSCYLQSETSNGILNFTRDFFKLRNTSVYSTSTHEGYLRNLVIRESYHTEDLMVNLVTSEENDELMHEYTTELLKHFPGITNVINNINLKKSQVATGDYEKIYRGIGFMYDMIGEYKFRISANSFFQTNTLQAEKLYSTALEFSDAQGNEIFYDLYSGAGTISIYVSKLAGRVFAFESVESALKDAQFNSIENGIENVSYYKADLNKSILPLLEAEKLPRPDIIILDPPRSGMNPKTVKDVIILNPSKIVYVSCNPASQARDIKLMCEEGYKLVKIRPVDMFPQTYHIENVALLIK
ncbi:MAG: 23S rRNA (uracil(1939)-C(5))-methyltransferase RlmD [Melioribacteraceae bacterium]|nr:23S rRNA (uracil(1939)-C(5))-methyltransferase RlmD [Melioribacteraceae bacterium]